jgi:hypothetical protein
MNRETEGVPALLMEVSGLSLANFKWALVSALMVIALPLHSAFATWCGRPSACELARTADVIFTGTARSVETNADGVNRGQPESLSERNSEREH